MQIVTHDPLAAARAPSGLDRPGVTARSQWRAVALPSEHGGWALTIEPALLGLLIAPSQAGGALALAGLLAFTSRTPLKLVLIDAWRRRWLPRTRLAAAVATVELALVGSLLAVAGAWAGWSWLRVATVAGPLVLIELWFDMRSRSRRLLPELCGAIGIGSVAAAIVVADGGPDRLAVGAWLLLAGRSLASIPYVQAQVRRVHRRPFSEPGVVGAQLLGIGVAAGAALADRRLLLGLAGVVLATLPVLWSLRREPPRITVLGLAQLAAGLIVIVLAAIGVWWI